jgi:quercetin dioxygenase-like cupin family protein
VIEGEGAFLGKDNAEIPAKTGDILISDIIEPHGVKATTDMRIIVTIAPPI